MHSKCCPFNDAHALQGSLVGTNWGQESKQIFCNAIHTITFWAACDFGQMILSTIQVNIVEDPSADLDNKCLKMSLDVLTEG